MAILELATGKATITTNPGGAGDFLRWSATGTPAAAGDLGMNVATGRAQQFRSAAVRQVADLDDIAGAIAASVFSFTHTTGAASTGALGFTPKFAIYSGAIRAGSGGANDRVGHFTGFATGTGTLALSAGLVVEQDAAGLTLENARSAGDDDAIGGSMTPAGVISFGTTFDIDLDVTAFGSANVTLDFGGASVSSHAGKLIVVGTP